MEFEIVNDNGLGIRWSGVNMIDILLAEHQHGHSDWQCDYAITARAGGTLYGCYKQSLRELHKRWRGLRELYGNAKASDCPAERFESAGVIRDTEREFLRFYGQAVALRRSLGLADDEAMPDDMRERLDVEMWAYRLRAMAAVDFITAGRIQRGTVELLQSCPPDMRREIYAVVLQPERHAELIEWYLNHDPQIPAPLAIPETQARAMLASFASTSGPALLPNYQPVAQ